MGMSGAHMIRTKALWPHAKGYSKSPTSLYILCLS